VDIVGVRVDDVSMAEAVAEARRLIGSPGSHQIVTPNAEFVMQARRNPAFRQALAAADLSIPDGAGLLLAGQILGTPLREHVQGTDLAVELARLAAAEGYRLFLLGAAEGVAAEAGRRLQARFPGLQIAGAYAGSPRKEDEDAIVERIRAATPVHVLLVAYGAPAQDLWIARNLPRLDVGVAMGVGGVFDYLSGRVPRAPLWLRRAGFDWLFRLVVQPWRWRRQLALPQFVALAIWTAATRRR
jgi:N-acetylglucosaminyldiphosphoundecaprenol N-acetyl-beta-D-mannosaminyltransferase